MPGEDSWGNEGNTREREKIDSERRREHTERSLRKCTGKPWCNGGNLSGKGTKEIYWEQMRERRDQRITTRI